MLTWRLPQALFDPLSTQDLIWKRSHCPQCQQPLKWFYLIPLVSWFLLRGQCAKCHSPISLRYPITELLTAFVTLLCLWHFGFQTMGYLAVLLSWFLIAISLIDLEHHLILDNLSLPLLWIGLIVNTQHIFTSPTNAILGAAVAYGLLWSLFHLYKLLTGKEGMGYGDFKMLAALSAWLGLQALPFILVIGSVSSLVVGLLLIALKKKTLQEEIPFGPYLALGGWGALFYLY